MNQKDRYIQQDEIDIAETIRKLWKEKILILSISLLFMVIGYVYGTLQPKLYKSEITFRDAPPSLFIPYTLHIDINQQIQIQSQLQGQSQQAQQQAPAKQKIALDFNNEFKLNLLSIDNLVRFAEQNDKIDDFKSYLKDKNIDIKEHLRGKFELIRDRETNIFINQYSLTLQEPLPGNQFLNDYIIFTKRETERKFIELISLSIVSEINFYKQNLEIAKSINLENPILKSMVEGNSFVNEPNALFYKGTKVLSKQIFYLDELLKNTKKFTLNYDPILERASTVKLSLKSPLIFAAVGFLLGLFFALIIVLMRYLLLNKD